MRGAKLEERRYHGKIESYLDGESGEIPFFSEGKTLAVLWTSQQEETVTSAI